MGRFQGRFYSIQEEMETEWNDQTKKILDKNDKK